MAAAKARREQRVASRRPTAPAPVRLARVELARADLPGAAYEDTLRA